MRRISALILTAALGAGGPAQAERAVAIPAVEHEIPSSGSRAVAVFAGGCFWGLEAVFEQVKGVASVTNGYAGGTQATANYAQVSTERTGHAEAVRITYDPRVVSYGTLLRVFFSVAHDPTQRDRQGPDHGPSYRSAIFPQDAGQRATAIRYIRQLDATKRFAGPIATRIEGGRFFPAEGYHQDFARRNPRYPYIVRWDAPKVAAFRAAFPTLAR